MIATTALIETIAATLKRLPLIPVSIIVFSPLDIVK
jgi:hypothetical protein